MSSTLQAPAPVCLPKPGSNADAPTQNPEGSRAEHSKRGPFIFSRIPQFFSAAGLLALVVAILLTGCTTTTVYQPVNYEAFNQQTVLLFQPPLSPPLSEELHAKLMQQAREGFVNSPYFSKILTESDVRALNDATLLGQFQVFGNTLSETGVPDPELSFVLSERMKAPLVSTVQIFHLPCPVCEEGDQVWLVGQIIQGESGELLFRMHIKNPISSGADLEAEATGMMQDFLVQINETARPKWHRLRFHNLKHKTTPDKSS